MMLSDSADLTKPRYLTMFGCWKARKLVSIIAHYVGYATYVEVFEQIYLDLSTRGVRPFTDVASPRKSNIQLKASTRSLADLPA